MYLQMVLVCVGFAIMLWNLWILLLVPLCAWLLQLLVIAPEEAYLKRKFGETYLAYKRRVRRSNINRLTMRYITIGLTLGMAAVLTCRSVSAQDPAAELRTIERERLRSLVEADVERARRLHADDFQLINPAGGALSKDAFPRPDRFR